MSWLGLEGLFHLRASKAAALDIELEALACWHFAVAG
jgi:hypothetical protein